MRSDRDALPGDDREANGSTSGVKSDMLFDQLYVSSVPRTARRQLANNDKKKKNNREVEPREYFPKIVKKAKPHACFQKRTRR